MTRARHRPKLQRCTFVPFAAPRARTPRKRPTQSFHRLTAALLALAACILIPGCKPTTGPDPMNRSALLSEREFNALSVSIEAALTRFGASDAQSRKRLAENLGAIVLKFEPSFAGGSIRPPMTQGGRIPITGSTILQTRIAARAHNALVEIEAAHDSPDARRVVLELRDKAADGMADEPRRYRDLFGYLEATVRAGNMEEESK